MERKGEKPRFFKVHFQNDQCFLIPALVVPTLEEAHEWSILGVVGVVAV